MSFRRLQVLYNNHRPIKSLFTNLFTRENYIPQFSTRVSGETLETKKVRESQGGSSLGSGGIPRGGIGCSGTPAYSCALLDFGVCKTEKSNFASCGFFRFLRSRSGGALRGLQSQQEGVVGTHAVPYMYTLTLVDKTHSSSDS